MSVAGMGIGLALTVICVMALGWPLLRPAKSAASAGRAHLLWLYERCIVTIREMDDDYRAGKLSEADYQVAREQWVQRGVQILQAAEVAAQQPEIAPVPLAEDVSLDQAIETAVRLYARS